MYNLTCVFRNSLFLFEVEKHIGTRISRGWILNFHEAGRKLKFAFFGNKVFPKTSSFPVVGNCLGVCLALFNMTLCCFLFIPQPPSMTWLSIFLALQDLWIINQITGCKIQQRKNDSLIINWKTRDSKSPKLSYHLQTFPDPHKQNYVFHPFDCMLVWTCCL